MQRKTLMTLSIAMVAGALASPSLAQAPATARPPRRPHPPHRYSP